MVFCEGCEIAVHQACFGLDSASAEHWQCSTCAKVSSNESGDRSCALCPATDGLLAPAVTSKGDCAFVHVVCALWNPLVRIGDVTTLSPIVLPAAAALATGGCFDGDDHETAEPS